jgi:two-component system, chemotaxis family, response regulator Rcp1
MGRVLDLLIVDDDPGQLRLVEALLADLKLLHHCYYAPNGPKALDFLNRRRPFEDVPRPNLILLDVNMPGMNGCEVLHHVKSDPDLRSIPVIMLSSSQALKDVNACYSEHANAYISKPEDLESTLDVLRDIDRFWGDTALLPR